MDSLLQAHFKPLLHVERMSPLCCSQSRAQCGACRTLVVFLPGCSSGSCKRARSSSPLAHTLLGSKPNTQSLAYHMYQVSFLPSIFLWNVPITVLHKNSWGSVLFCLGIVPAVGNGKKEAGTCPVLSLWLGDASAVWTCIRNAMYIKRKYECSVGLWQCHWA